jgi:Domain of unknown function (DUF4194)
MTDANARPALSPVLISLMKGVLYSESEPLLWQSLLELQARVRDYVSAIGLELILDEAEGYGYLRQKERDDSERGPRLIIRRQLSYPVSLLLVLLRKRLAEFDAGSGDARLIVDRPQILELARLFLPETTNEARLFDRLDASIERLVDLGFLRRLHGSADRYEVRRVLKAFIDAQWLSEFSARLAEYREHAAGVGINAEEST